MATPQTPQGFIAWMKWVEGRIAFILERLNNVLANTGLSIPSPGVTQVDGNLNVVGSSTVSGTNGIKSSNYVPGTAGWNFTGTSLEANTGVIGNGALANPVTPGVVNQTANNFALGSGAFAEVVGQNVTVPSGCTTLMVNVSVWVQAVNAKTTGGNNGAGGDYIYAEAHAGGLFGGHTATGVSGNGGTATASSGYAQVLTGLTPGGTVRIAGYSVSDYGITADPSNKAILTAALTWLR